MSRVGTSKVIAEWLAAIGWQRDVKNPRLWRLAGIDAPFEQSAALVAMKSQTIALRDRTR